MATYYWVGGAGTWNATSTTNWASSSGGTGGAGVPTIADDVIFDGSSGTGTVTVTDSSAVCKDFTVTASQALIFSGTLGTSGNSPSTGCAGNVTLPSGGSTVFTSFILTTIGSATTSVTTNGKTLSRLYASKAVGGITNLADPLTTSNDLNFYGAGTFNTNNYAMTSGGSNSNLTGATVSVNLGSSTWTVTGSTSFNTVSIGTFNAGTSTIIFSNASPPQFSGQGRTYYNVSFTGGGTSSVVISGSNTFNQLSVTATTGIKPVTFDSTQTIGTLTTTGTTIANRVSFASSVGGTQRTLTVASVGTLTNTDWQDINFAGAASPWSAPLGVRSLGNNTGITFDATPLYWIGGTGNWSDGTKWSTSSGGSAANAIPGAQTTVYFNGSSGTGTSTINITSYCNDIVCTGYAGTLSGSSTWYIYGSMTLASGMTYSKTGTTIFAATSSGKTIDTFGKTLGNTTFNGVGGEWTLQSNTTFGTTSLSAGTINTNGYTVTCATLAAISTPTCVLNLGSSTLNIAGTTCVLTGSGFTLNAGTSTVVYTPTTGSASVSFDVGAKTFYNLTFTNNSSQISLNGAITVSNNLTITGNAYTTLYVPALFLYNNITVNGTFTATGNAVNKPVFVTGSSSTGVSTQRTITAAAVSLTNVNFRFITGAGTATWSGTSVGNAGTNTGITFTTPKTVYWNLAAGGAWATATAWATTSGGTPSAANYPLPQDTAIIEDTGLNTSATITLGLQCFLPNINMSTRTLAATFNFDKESYACGNITWDANVACTIGARLYIYSSTTLTSAGVTLVPVTVLTGATLTVADALTMTSNAGVQIDGTLTLNANATFYSARLGTYSTVNFSTYKIILTGNATTIFTGNTAQTVTGTPVIDCTYAGSTGTRTLSTGSPTEANAISFNITAGTDAVSLGTFVAKSLDFTGYAGTASASGSTYYKSLKLSSGMTMGSWSALNFSGTSTGNTITTSGKTIPASLNFIGGEWALQDAFTNTGQISLSPSISSVALSTNNYNITSSATSPIYYAKQGSNTATLNLGSSTVTVNGLYSPEPANTSGLTINGGTSTVNTVSGVNIAVGNSVTLYDVTVTPGSSSSYSQLYFYGVSSARNLTVTGNTAYACVLNVSQTTLSGALSLSGNATYRMAVIPNIFVTSVPTISAASVSLSNLNITRITASGASAPWSGTSLADGGGNSNITFDATPRTLYWVGGTGSCEASNTANWSLSSGGSGGQAYPRICDTVYFDSNSGGGSVTFAIYSYLPTTICSSGYTGTFLSSLTSYGNVTLASTMTTDTSFNLFCRGITPTITTNGKSIQIFRADSPTSKVTLTENLTLTNSLQIQGGELDTAGYSVSAVSCSLSYNATLTLGSSVLTLTGSSPMTWTSGGTFNAGTSEILLTPTNNATPNFSTFSRVLNKLTYAPTSGAGTLTLSTLSNQTIGTFKTTTTSASTVQFVGGYTYTINDWQVSGKAGALITLSRSTGTTPYILASGSSGTQGANYLSISNSTATPSLTWYAGSNSVDGGGNTGWIFADESIPVVGNGLFFGSNF